MNVRDQMRSPAPTVSPTSRVGDIAKLMLEEQVSGVLVAGPDGGLLGMVNETDLVGKHARVHVPLYLGILGGVLPFGSQHSDEDVRRVLAVSASDLMDDDPPTIEATADIDDAATLMVERAVDPVAVMDTGRAVGIISRRDIMRLLVLEEQDEGRNFDAP